MVRSSNSEATQNLTGRQLLFCRVKRLWSSRLPHAPRRYAVEATLSPSLPQPCESALVVGQSRSLQGTHERLFRPCMQQKHFRVLVIRDQAAFCVDAVVVHIQPCQSTSITWRLPPRAHDHGDG